MILSGNQDKQDALIITYSDTYLKKTHIGLQLVVQSGTLNKSARDSNLCYHPFYNIHRTKFTRRHKHMFVESIWKALILKGVRAFRGKFGPLWSKKLKVAFHQFHPIGLLEEWSKCLILALFFFLPLLWEQKLPTK